MEIRYKKLSENAKEPTKAHESDAGFDLYCTRYGYDGDCWVCHSDVAFEIPEGYMGLVFPRSSIADTAMILSNGVGVIDSGYRNEITAKFRVLNNNRVYREGERFAQLVIVPYPKIELKESAELSDTDRGFGGYGSSGR